MSTCPGIKVDQDIAGGGKITILQTSGDSSAILGVRAAFYVQSFSTGIPTPLCDKKSKNLILFNQSLRPRSLVQMSRVHWFPSSIEVHYLIKTFQAPTGL
jgi:hypothetical protein